MLPGGNREKELYSILKNNGLGNKTEGEETQPDAGPWYLEGSFMTVSTWAVHDSMSSIYCHIQFFAKSSPTQES